MTKAPDGQVILATVLWENDDLKVHWLTEKKEIMPIVTQIVRDKILHSTDDGERTFYREVAIRILKGYSGLTNEFSMAIAKKKIHKKNKLSYLPVLNFFLKL